MKRKKSFMKRSMAGALAMCVFLGSAPLGGLQKVQAAEEVQLNKIILRQIAKLTPEFSPDVTDYSGTAYMTTTTLNIFPFKENASDTVKIGKVGATPTEVTGDKVDVPLTTGMNDIEVTVTRGGVDKVYTLHINKVETDYRGRTIIPKNEITLETDFGGDASKIADNDNNTAWTPTNVPTNATEENPATSFIADLGKTRWVSRIQAVFGGSYALWNNMAQISVSTDKTNWTTVVNKGNMRADQTDVRYEFGKSYQARYIKFEVIKFAAAAFSIKEMTFYEDANGEFPVYDPPEGGDVQFVPSNPNIARGQEIVIEKGYPVSGWMPSGGYGRGTMTKEESELLGWDGPLFYDPELTNETFMLNNPDALWGIAKAPWGDNGMGNAGTPRDFVPANLQPYIKNAINFCYGDEGGYSVAENARFKEWFDWSKEKYPGTIVHSNQAGGRGWEGNFNEYVKQSEPDLLSFDNYYWHLNDEPYNGIYKMLNTGLWKDQREAALLGVDGTGELPLLFGQYLDVYLRDQPVSQKNLVTNLSILTGMKWLNYFRIEYQFDQCYLFDRDGTPTLGLYEWGEVNRYLKNIDDYILKLNNDYVIVKPGQYKDSTGATVTAPVATGWHMGGFAENTEKNTEFGIADVTATNLNANCNDGLAGDVALGYFNALTGLTEAELQETFGCTAPKAFMVLNGLNGGKYATWNNSNVVKKEAGSAENTKQEITLTFTDTTGKTLKKINHQTGTVETVNLTGNQLTMTLGGGEADLFFWEENLNAEATSADTYREAKLAFDGAYSTYWAAQEGQMTPTLSTTFKEKEVKKVIINEKGNGITGFTLQYNNGTSWIDITTGTTIGRSKEIVLDQAVNASGLRLIVTGADKEPAIREIRSFTSSEIGSATHTITVTAGNNGSVETASIQVPANGDAVIKATGNEGFVADKGTVGKLYYYADNGEILIPEVTADMTINVTFKNDIADEITVAMLRELVTETLALNKLNYVGSTWASLMLKVEAAQSVLEDVDADNARRKTAYEGIVTAKSNLRNAAATTPKDGITETTDFIDNTDPAITYTGSWSLGEGAWTVNKHMNSLSIIDNAVAGNAQCEFIGTGIEVFMEGRPNSANVNVEITNQSGETVATQTGIVCTKDITSLTPPSTLESVYSKQDLPYGKYTIKLTFAAGTGGTRAALDGFKVTNTRGDVTVQGITLNPSSMTIKVGETRQITATLEPADVVDAEITWAVDFSNIISVEDGLVTALSPGRASVFVSSGSVNSVCAVNVEAADTESYTVRFDATGGNTTVETKVVAAGAQVGELPTPTKDEYTFKGWFTAETNGTQIGTTTPVNSNVTYYAQWTQQTANTYTINFNADGGTASQTVKVITAGDAIGELPTATKDGYTFVGWFTESAGGVKVLSTRKPAGDVTYYARWEMDMVFYAISFNANGGQFPDSVLLLKNIIAGQAVGSLPTPTRADHTFDGWFTEVTGGTQITAETVPSGSVIYYARWTQSTPGPILDTYTISFNANGGNVGETSRNVTEGDALGTLPVPTRSGFTFDGWFTAEVGGMAISAETVPAASTTYYAQWTEISIASYTVTFDGNQGTASETSRTVVAGEAVGTLPTATRSGYTFTGWFTQATGGTQITTATIPEANVTYYAQWQVQQVTPAPGPTPVIPVVPVTPTVTTYTVTFDGNGGTASKASAEINSGEAIGTLPTATRAGYNFAGWFTAATGGTEVTAETKVTAAMTVYAQWAEVPGGGAIPEMTGKKTAGKSAIITWNKVKKATEYQIFMKAGKGDYELVKTVAGSKTKFTIAGLKTGKNYKFRVTASTGKNAKKKVTYGKSVTMSWKNVSGYAGYDIQLKIGKGEFESVKEVTKGGTVTYTVKSAKVGKKYTFRLRGYNTVNNQKEYTIL